MSNKIDDLWSKYRVWAMPEAKKVIEKSINGYFGKIGDLLSIYNILVINHGCGCKWCCGHKKSTIYHRFIKEKLIDYGSS